MKKCQICPKDAFFECSKCNNAYYCSKDHQIQHWKDQHKQQCFQKVEVNDGEFEELKKKRYLIRKQFYENYGAKSFNLCVLDSKVLLNIEKKIYSITNDEFDLFEYGATICLLTKSLILVKDKVNAKLTLEGYLVENEKLINSLQNIPQINGQFTEQQKQKFQLKMNLLSTIANLSYVLEMKSLDYYVLYTKNIEKSFGQRSLQASNCYFLLGCYLAEEGYFNKAIACLKKAIIVRGKSHSGDCYFNIGILYKLQGKLSKAIQMFEKALKSRLDQYGEEEKEIAEVNENLGIIFMELNDFKTAMTEYEAALRIRSSNPISPEYRNLIQLIQELYEKLSLYLDSDEFGPGKKPQFLVHLQHLIGNQAVFWDEKPMKRGLDKNKNSKKDKLSEEKQAPKQTDKKEKKKVISNSPLLVLTDQLIERLSPTELFKLSELQIELSAYKSNFGFASIIGTSSFLQGISPENLEMLKQENEKLFEEIRTEELDKKK